MVPQTLQILAGYDLQAFGHNSADYLHTVAEALKLAFADRDRFVGDPDFVAVPIDGLLSAEYAATRRALLEGGLDDRQVFDITGVSDRQPMSRLRSRSWPPASRKS